MTDSKTISTAQASTISNFITIFKCTIALFCKLIGFSTFFTAIVVEINTSFNYTSVIACSFERRNTIITDSILVNTSWLFWSTSVITS
jgi:hypothetical protein